MIFAVDIDGTIAYRHVPGLLAACNERFRLGIAPARLQQTTTVLVWHRDLSNYVELV